MTLFTQLGEDEDEVVANEQQTLTFGIVRVVKLLLLRPECLLNDHLHRSKY